MINQCWHFEFTSILQTSAPSTVTIRTHTDTHTYTNTHVHAYTHICVWVYVCVFVVISAMSLIKPAYIAVVSVNNISYEAQKTEQDVRQLQILFFFFQYRHVSLYKSISAKKHLLKNIMSLISIKMYRIGQHVLWLIKSKIYLLNRTYLLAKGII